MSFIIHATPQGLIYGYKANDNITFIHNLATELQASRKIYDYLYENGCRDKIQAYFAVGTFDAVHEMEAKLYSQGCLTLKKIREYIGKTNATVVVVANGRINMINKNATMSQVIAGDGVTFTFGDVDTSTSDFAKADFVKLGYIQQVITYVPQPVAE